MKKTLHLAIVLSALICSVASFGKTYTLIMLDNGKNSDGYTAIGNYPDSVLSSGIEYLTSVANENVYLGKTGFGLKLGTSSKAGAITLLFKQTLRPTKITVSSAVWVNSSGKYDSNKSITVNSQTITMEDTSSPADYSVTMDGLTDMKQLRIAAVKTSNNRFYLQKVVIEMPDDEETPEIDLDYRYDFGVQPLQGGVAEGSGVISVTGKSLNSNITATLNSPVFSISEGATLPKEGGNITIAYHATTKGIFTGRLLLQSTDTHGNNIQSEMIVSLKTTDATTHAGTRNDPLTVTDAQIIASKLQVNASTENEVYIRGTICSDVLYPFTKADFMLCDTASIMKVQNLSAPELYEFEEGMLNDGDEVLLYGYITNISSPGVIYPATLIEPELDYIDWTQIQSGYYDPADNTQASVLKDSLMKIISGGRRYAYGKGSNYTWDGFYYTDREELSNRVLDMYSNEIRYFDPENPTNSVSGFDIEHSFPKSWWGGDDNDAYKDLHHLTPADASANRSKSNNPPGTVLTAGFDNGSFKTGTPADSCPASKVFEPADEYKGDFARMYFYIATAYGNFTWVNTSPTDVSMDNSNWQEFKPWLRDLLLKWHRQDPVSAKEIRRNAQVARIQHNRNPFIDYPCLAEYIWGNKQNQTVDLSKLLLTTQDEYQTTSDKSGCTCQCIETGFEQMEQTEDKPRIIMIDGTLRIIHNGKQYTIMGMPL